MKAKIAEPAASPSRPSVRFTALMLPRIMQHRPARTTPSAPSSRPGTLNRVNESVVCTGVNQHGQRGEADGHHQQAEDLGPLVEAEVALAA